MKEILYVFFISMLPVVELRGAIPVGAGLGLDPVENFIAAVAGNLLPVPFIILFIRRVIAWLSSKSERLAKFLDKFVAKRVSKHASLKYASEFVALAVFVAIPLPGTGAWTGALIAGVLGMRMRNALPAAVAGVLGAGMIMTALSYGVKTAIG